MSHDTEFYLEKTLSENPSDIAHLLKYLYFSHIRFDGKFWYSFSNHKWNITDEDDSPSYLSSKMISLTVISLSQANIIAKLYRKIIFSPTSLTKILSL